MFDAATYIERRKNLSGHVGSGLILLLGNPDSPMNCPANIFPFRQDSSFLYFVGIDLPRLAAVIDVDSQQEFLFGDDQEPDDVVWSGKQESLASWRERAGMARQGPWTGLAGMLEKALSAGRNVHYLPPYRAARRLDLHEHLDIPAAQTMTGASLPLIRAVVKERSTKSDEEIAQIEEAVGIARVMHDRAMKMARPGTREQEIVGSVEGLARSMGGRISFPMILSIHGETLHNPHHAGVLEEGRMLLHDSGAETALHYCSDITRTMPVSGRFTTKQKEIYQIVLDAQENSIRAMKPGVMFKEVHMTAARTIAAGLKEIGLMRGDTEEAVNQGAHALFFPHGLGHMLGLDVHDMEDLGEDHVGYDATVSRSSQFGLQYLRMARELEPRFVLTVEPGIYFIPHLIDTWQEEKRFEEFIDYTRLEAYRDFNGIRLEDDILVTDEESRILGPPIPRTIQDVEDATRS